MTNEDKMIEFVATCSDEFQLRALIENAKKKGAVNLEVAAFRRLVSIRAEEEPGTLEHDFWQSIHALELALSEERKKTTRLARTRQKIDRDGILKTVESLALRPKEAEGFKMLIEKRMPELTAEAVVLRHQDRFSTEVVAAAHRRLELVGVNVSNLTPAHVVDQSNI